jgi:hypothetical protein
MATVVSYPKISRNMWSKLRAKFKKSIPAVVTPAFVSSIVEMADASAVSNVIKPLQALGLLDDQRKPTALASQWRHDDEYSAVCKTIREQIYPQDLLDTYPGGEAEDKSGIIRWFMKAASVGDVAARMFADTYSILAQADATQLEEKAQNTSPTKTRAAANKAARKSPPAQASATVPPSVETPHVPAANAHHKPLGKFPAVHIDVQVHISPETSPEQIDRIFESMAKHLGNFTG